MGGVNLAVELLTRLPNDKPIGSTVGYVWVRETPPTYRCSLEFEDKGMVNINEVPDTLEAPARYAFVITPNSDADLSVIPTKGIKVGSTGGTLIFHPYDRPGTAITIQVAANEHVKVIPRRVLATSTATTLTGLT